MLENSTSSARVSYVHFRRKEKKKRKLVFVLPDKLYHGLVLFQNFAKNKDDFSKVTNNVKISL